MMRVSIGICFLFLAAGLFGYAGGIDITSPAAWMSFTREWSLPAKDDNVRGMYLLLGALAALLAMARLLTPMSTRRTQKA